MTFIAFVFVQVSFCILIGSFNRSKKLIPTVFVSVNCERQFVHMTELSFTFCSIERQFVPLSFAFV